MKKLFPIVFIFIISAYNQAIAHYDLSVPVEGESIANNELQFLVIQKAYKILAPKVPTCSDFHISNTQILHYPYDVKKNKKGQYIKGYWEELWTVNACGKSKQLPITFFIKKKATQFQIDSNALE